VEAVMMTGAASDDPMPDRLAPFEAIGRLNGASILDVVGAATRAGINCGSCCPEIRVLSRTARFRKAA